MGALAHGANDGIYNTNSLVNKAESTFEIIDLSF
jgi:hypothetical protein